MSNKKQTFGPVVSVLLDNKNRLMHRAVLLLGEVEEFNQAIVTVIEHDNVMPTFADDRLRNRCRQDVESLQMVTGVVDRMWQGSFRG